MMDQWISVEDTALLAEEAARAESQGGLTDAQLSVIHRICLFKLFVPKDLGGLAMELPEALRLEEGLASLDGSLGWTVTLCSGASWFVGFMDPSVVSDVFADAAVCFGGSGMASGVATRQGDGYVVNGDWKYATGAPHNTIFTANCLVMDKSGPVLDRAGHPVVQSFYFHRDEVELLEDWDTMGLKATASHSFRVRDCMVGPERSFLIDPAHAVMDGPIYRFPFVQFAELTLAANYLGMFRKFLNLAADLMSDSMPESVLDVFREAKTVLNAQAEKFYGLADVSWHQLGHRGEIHPSILEEISLVSRKMVQEGYAMITALYPKTGIRGATNSDPINRIWRDLFTASQHVIFRS